MILRERKGGDGIQFPVQHNQKIRKEPCDEDKETGQDKKDVNPADAGESRKIERRLEQPDQKYRKGEGKKNPQGVEVHDSTDDQRNIVVGVFDRVEAGDASGAFKISDGNEFHLLVVA